MKYLSKYTKFNLINESLEDEKRDELLPNLIDILQDLIDKNYNILLKSVKGQIKTDDYINNGDVTKFNPTFKAGNKIKSKFEVIINLNSKDNEEFSDIISEMTPVINRLSELGWSANNFDVKTIQGSDNKEMNFRFKSITYTFTKPDIKTEDEPPSIDEIKKHFEYFGLSVKDIEFDGNICYIGAESYSYDGEIPSDIEDKLDRMIVELGFDDYEAETDLGNTWLSVRFWIDPTEDEN